MLSYFYYLFIAPLEWLMQAVLERGYALTGSWGLALIFMSLVVNILLLPLYHLAETWQDDERIVQQRMAKYLPHIRKTFKGRERFMLIRTVYRQHDYHPLMALRTSFGFLIQVPFFFAAYHFLSSYAPLAGASFCFLHDLSKPDAIMSLAGFDINVLPIVMTLVNAVSGLVYTNRLSTRDKVQSYVLAALFLVFLYTAASGLVFYWTCNNVFSLVKNMVYERLGTFSHGRKVEGQTWQKRWAENCERAGCVLTAFWTTRRLCLLFGAAFALLCVRFWLTPLPVNTFAPVVNALAVFLLALCLVALLAVLLGHCLAKRLSWLAFVFLCGFCCWALAANHPPYLRTCLLCLFFVCAITQDGVIFRRINALAEQYDEKELKAAAAKALASAALTVFAVSPAMLIAQDGTLYSPLCLALLTIAACASFAVPLWIFSSSQKNLRLILAVVFTAACFIAVGYTCFLKRDYGVLDSFILTKAEVLNDGWQTGVDLAVCLVLTTLAAVLVLWKKKLLSYVLSGILLVGIAAGAHSWFCVVQAVGKTDDSLALAAAERKQPVQLSRTSPNVLIIMLDMFTGDHLRLMREEHPELMASYDGFTWYPDTISEGYATVMSLPSMIAGRAAAPGRFAKDDGVSLEKKIDRELTGFFDWLKGRGYTARIAESEDIAFVGTRPYVDAYLYMRTMLSEADSGGRGERNAAAEEKSWFSKAVLAASFGIFKASPWSMRRHIYQNGRWLIGETKFAGSERTRNHYVCLKALPQFTAIDDGPSRYTFFHNLLPHGPWYISGTTLEPTDEDSYPETKDMTEMRSGCIPEHYFAEQASIKIVGQYLDFLKQEGVYDNTLVVVCSDHGCHDSQALCAVMGDEYPGRPDSLLLVKPADAHGVLRIDRSPVSNSDIHSIVEASIEHKPFSVAANRVRYHAVGPYNRSQHPQNNYGIKELWKVTGSRDNKEHWEKVQ